MSDSLERYGTIAFSMDFMRSTIRLDLERRQLDFSVWIESVPKIYRDNVVAIILDLAEALFYARMTPALLDSVITSLWERIHAVEADDLRGNEVR